MSRLPAAGPRAGFTLIELLVSLVVASIVMGSAVSVFRSQSIGFRRGGQRMEMSQNLRYAVSTVDRVLRTTGAGTAPRQPMLVYGGNDVIVFNTNYASDIQDGNAVNINPDLPAAAVLSLTTATRITIPNTAILYPDTNYFWGVATPSRAETIAFFFRPDSSTATLTDFVLFQKVNNLPAEVVATNIRAYPGRPFLEYWYDSAGTGGILSTRQLAAARIPVRHTEKLHGSVLDVGASALADSIRIVRLNMVVGNGATGADSTSRRISTMIYLPNNGLVQLQACGDIPILTGVLLATPNLPGDPPAVTLRWNPSSDETGGETDVTQYNVYYRLQAATDWQPFTTVPAGQPTYVLTSGDGLMTDSTYVYAVAAQDCTPKESPTLVSAPTIVNP